MTTFTGPHWNLSRQKRKELREQADRKLSRPSRAETLARAEEVLADVRERLAPSGEWKDASQADPWGRPPRGNQLLAKQWGGGNCLWACIASLLNAEVSKIPDPVSSYDADPDWHDHYNTRLEKATGHRLEFLPASLCPPRNPNQLWIAGIHERGDRDGHAVVARGAFVVHDPSGLYRGSLPLDRITDGMVVVPTKRVIPVLSPMGSGYKVVPA